MIGNREYNETYHVFEKVKSMLKKKCIKQTEQTG